MIKMIKLITDILTNTSENIKLVEFEKVFS